jgi:hypothetical protein
LKAIVIKNNKETQTVISHIQLINFSQQAKIQHVSKMFPFDLNQKSELSKIHPNLSKMILSKIKSRTLSDDVCKIKSNIWTVQKLIEIAGFAIPKFQLHLIKDQIFKLCKLHKNKKKYEEINYWGQMMTKTKDYQVIIGIKKNLSFGLKSMDFWVSQDLKNWTMLKSVSSEMIHFSK